MNYRAAQLRHILKQHQSKWHEEKNILQKEHQEQLRKINLLFDDKAKNYKEIDFNGLYTLLKKISEKKPK